MDRTGFGALQGHHGESIGAGAFMLTDTLHEVVGHGGACLLIGQKITLITSVYFRSRPGSFLTDIGGPAANLVFGLLIYGLLKTTKNLSPLTRIFLMFGMADNFFWFSGTLLQSSFSKTGDWVYAIKELHIGDFGRPALIIAAIAAYWISIRMIKLPILFIVKRRQGGYEPRASMGFNVKVLVLFIIFCLTLGRGI